MWRDRTGEGAPPGPNNPSPNGPNMTYLPVPFYISTLGYGLYMESTYRTGYSLGADDETLGLGALATQLHLHQHIIQYIAPVEQNRVLEHDADVGHRALD